MPMDKKNLNIPKRGEQLMEKRGQNYGLDSEFKC